VRGHIIKSVKDHLWLLYWAWVPAGHRTSIGQMKKDVSRISLVCLFAIFLSGFLHVLSCDIKVGCQQKSESGDPPWRAPHPFPT
jgi:hypothetical protein